MAITDPRHLPQEAAGPAAVESCWMCGIRLPADYLVPDGGSACADVRWYCVDTWGCTERWTARRSRPAGPGLPELNRPGHRGAAAAQAPPRRPGAGGLRARPGTG